MNIENMNIEPTGTMVESQGISGGAGVPDLNGQLLVPKMDKFPILPDAGQVTDIVSTRESVPWFDSAHPDTRPEAVERGCQQ